MEADSKTIHTQSAYIPLGTKYMAGSQQKMICQMDKLINNQTWRG